MLTPDWHASCVNKLRDRTDSVTENCKCQELIWTQMAAVLLQSLNPTRLLYCQNLANAARTHDATHSNRLVEQCFKPARMNVLVV